MSSVLPAKLQGITGLPRGEGTDAFSLEEGASLRTCTRGSLTGKRRNICRAWQAKEKKNKNRSGLAGPASPVSYWEGGSRTVEASQ